MRKAAAADQFPAIPLPGTAQVPSPCKKFTRAGPRTAPADRSDRHFATSLPRERCEHAKTNAFNAARPEFRVEIPETGERRLKKAS